MFLHIQDGDYTINTSMISDIEWLDGEATVTMASGNEFTFEGRDFDDLCKVVGYTRYLDDRAAENDD